MTTITSETGEKIHEIMEKPRKDNMVDRWRKLARARLPKRAGDALTCSEAQIEAILSEGEST